jgi:hypothetical protein
VPLGLRIVPSYVRMATALDFPQATYTLPATSLIGAAGFSLVGLPRKISRLNVKQFTQTQGSCALVRFQGGVDSGEGKMPCRVVNERWVGSHLLCDVVLDHLAVLGVTACSESVKPWFNPAIPEDVRNEIEKAVLAVYCRGRSDSYGTSPSPGAGRPRGGRAG